MANRSTVYSKLTSRLLVLEPVRPLSRPKDDRSQKLVARDTRRKTTLATPVVRPDGALPNGQVRAHPTRRVSARPICPTASDTTPGASIGILYARVGRQRRQLLSATDAVIMELREAHSESEAKLA